MGNTQSVQEYNFDLINGYELEDIWRQFEEDCPYINDKQVDLFHKIVPNRYDKYEIFRNFNVSDEYSLKHYMLDLITKNEYVISYMDKNVLHFYFGDTLYEKLIEIFPSYNDIVMNKLELHDIDINDEQHSPQDKEDDIDDVKTHILLSFIKMKDMKQIYKHYPDINLLREKTKNFSIHSIDYPLEYNFMYEYGYQYRYINNEMTDKKLYYLKFYDWCSFDIDATYSMNNTTNTITLEDIDKQFTDLVTKVPELSFCLYKTTNGFHLHIMNKRISYNSLEYQTLSKLFKSDKWYYIFTRTNGYKLRLNKKDSEEKYVATFIKYFIGKQSKVSDDCFYYKGMYDFYLNKHEM